ncbi:FAD-dependent thymidylate synthase [Calothrix sp. FACHB-1219]|uniref:FAD-dependent thymidylate synthase n=1 Tax=unclassified Calothrix TaxID=2619626 RepID=UPI0016893EA9|nr:MULTISPECIES: FAD-dependent thymidylate synthase [unclassified Calothrix]MBD2201759.1 FAD-dependent thymidylate synthase [Calothrix sp. FACHB-168]MBD2217445.1 FAD-dependent thymidylate synthase [Calothrix sp. FACHB-1219]
MDRYIYNYNRELGIASIEDRISGIRVLTILYNNEIPELKRATYMAYLAARYSRSDLSIADIAGDVLAKGKFTNSMRTIVHNYGHSSVADLGNVLVCIEEVPGFVADRFFYTNYCVAGQQRSSRYQDFSKAKWAAWDVSLFNYLKNNNSTELELEYDSIMRESIENYTESIEVTKDHLADMFSIDRNLSSTRGVLNSRSLDCSRFLLPIGANSSFAALMSLRNWSTYIRQCKGSSSYVERQIGEMLLDLLKGNEELSKLGYVPEGDVLIRHTDPVYFEEEVVYQLIEVLRGHRKDNFNVSLFVEDMWSLVTSPNVYTSWNGTHNDLLEKLHLLDNPIDFPDIDDYVDGRNEDALLKELSEILFSSYSQYNTMGDIGISGAIAIDGMADMGSLRDLVRHRSLNKFIPLYNNNVNFLNELRREESLCYLLPAYTQGNPAFRKWYTDRLNNTYKRIKDWVSKASNQGIDDRIVMEYGRYLLPFAHCTFYRFYGDMDKFNYTIRTRVRNGGHINYRLLVYKWLKSLANSDKIWGYLLDVIDEPNILSEHEFLDRS